MTTLPQCCGAVMLLCALAMLVRHRPAAVLGLYRGQALALSAAVLAQGSESLLFVAMVALIKATLFPIALRRLPARFHSIATGLPAGLALLIGFGLVCVSLLAALPLKSPGIAIALSILLLGLCIMAARREPAAQLIGFLVVENALIFAAISVPALPFVAVICAALFALSDLLIARISHSAEQPA